MSFPTEDHARWCSARRSHNQIIPQRRPGFVPNKPNLNKQDVQLANALLDRFGLQGRGMVMTISRNAGRQLLRINWSIHAARDRPRDR